MYRRNKEYHKINRIKSYGVCRTYFQLKKITFENLYLKKI